MAEETKWLLVMLALTIPVGVLAGLVLRRRFPHACERYQVFASSLPWWCFGCLALFFAVQALALALAGRWAFAALHAAATLLQLIAMISALRRPPVANMTQSPPESHS